MSNKTWRVLVESRSDVLHRDKLDLIADTVAALGHHVACWRGPLSGRVRDSRILLDCDLAILCNGTTPHYGPVLNHLKRNGVDTLFVELGWYPQSTTMQIDPFGINADASWVGEPLSQQGITPIRVRSTGELLVLLQHEQDTQITCHSSHFSEMSEFLAHLGRYSALPLRVRPHPKFPPGSRVRRVVEHYGMTWDRAPCMNQSLQRCRAVACINSSGGVEALAQHVPVLCFGKAIYRHPGVVYCLGHDGRQLADVTNEILAGRCTLFAERVECMVQRIRDHQWTIDTIPDRLPKLIDAILSQRVGPRTRGEVGWRDRVSAAPTFLTTYVYPKLRRDAFKGSERNAA